MRPIHRTHSLIRLVECIGPTRNEGILRGKSKTEDDQKWLKRFGEHVSELIRKAGYKSPYDFWINHAGESLSRSSLNYLVVGKFDPKATTLRKLAKLLNTTPAKLLDFK
jgi:hypothetical protein